MDENLIWIVASASVAGILAFFGGIALVVWAAHRGKLEELKLRAEKQRFEHEEQMRALELGQVPPHADLARMQTDAARAGAAAIVGVLVPVCMAVTATITTLVDVKPEGDTKKLSFLIVVWSLAAAVSLVTVVLSTVAIRGRRPPPPPKETKVRRSPFEDKPPTVSGVDTSSTREQAQIQS
jgi:drug/metabolite transporter (DMT)-like permease